MKILLTFFVLFFSSTAFGWQKCTQGNCENGYGTYVNKPLIGGSSKYVGNWKNDKLDGVGDLVLIEGKKYSGEFKKDKYHGQGTMTLKDGKIIKGLWKKGEFVK